MICSKNGIDLQFFFLCFANLKYERDVKECIILQAITMEWCQNHYFTLSD